MGDRWLHVQAVGHEAEQLAQRGYDVPDVVIMSAWLHDVGYANTVAGTGFHPLDGAEWLRQQAAPEGLVALVAYHSGAQFEAEERGLAGELARFPAPDRDQLDVLTFIDMSTSPSGERVAVNERLSEILMRYPDEHPVHRAVSRSRGYLAESADRAARRLGQATSAQTGSAL